MPIAASPHPTLHCMRRENLTCTLQFAQAWCWSCSWRGVAAIRDEPELGEAGSAPREDAGGRAGRLDHRRLAGVGPRPGRAPAAGASDPQSQYEYWAERRLRGVRFRNCGVFGERTDEIARRLDRCARGAKVLIVQGGINDIAQGKGIEGAARNLRAMVRRGRRLGLRVALVEVLPWNNGYPRADPLDPGAEPPHRRHRPRPGRARVPLVRPARGPARARADAGRADRPTATTRRSRATGAWPPTSAYRAASSFARSSTESIIGSVSLPVNVFCWLTWKQPSSTGPADVRLLGAVAELRLGLGGGAGQAQRGVPRERAQADDHLRGRSAPAPARRRAGSVSRSAGVGLLAGGRAAHRRGHERAGQLQPVVARERLGLVGHPGAEQARRTGSRPSGRR